MTNSNRGLLALGSLAFGVGIGLWAVQRWQRTPRDVVLLQTESLQIVGDSAALCIVASLRDGSMRLGKVAQLVRLTAQGTKARPIVDTTHVRRLCVDALQNADMPLDMPFTNVVWTAKRIPRDVPSHTS